jgi:lysozyme
MRANPGFNRVGKGMVLRLPKEDPRLTRQRKIKRRMKDYVPPPEEGEDTTNQGIPTEGEEGLSEGEVSETENIGLSAAASVLSGASLGGLDDPAFEDEIISSIAETAKKMGLIEEGSFQSKMGKVSTASGKASSTTKPQFKTKEGGVVSSGLTTYSEAQTQAGESSQTATGSTTPPITLTDEQIDALKDNLEKMGLDVDVAMAELGLGEGAAASSTASQTTGEGMDDGDEDKDGPGGKVARPAEPDEPTQTETPDDEIPEYQDITTREELEAWFGDAYDPKGSNEEMDRLEKMYLEKRKELMREERARLSTRTPIPKPPIIEYVIQSGDTLEQIALENGCTIPEIMEINSIDNPNMIIAGDTLTFPQRLGEYAIMPERASNEGQEFVKDHEIFIETLYDDLGPGNGSCTIGYGHKVHDGPCDGRAEETEFLNGISKPRALEIFKKDISDAADSVRLYVKVPLNKNQFDALVSFVFNTGRGTLIKSDMLRFLNQGQYEKVPEEMMKYESAEGGEAPGLKTRRQDEADLFSTGDYGE